MGSFTIEVNGQAHMVEVNEKTPLLWVLRETLGLTGTKYSCGIGQCGSCTVHLDDVAVRSCTIPIEQAVSSSITTIEGLSTKGDHPLQEAWLEGQVPQCGFCQPGQIMQAAALLRTNPRPTQAEIIHAMTGVLCRCGTYQRILHAIEAVVEAGGAS
jgi:isoquinoline 1-oxidoreductase alpha subunit